MQAAVEKTGQYKANCRGARCTSDSEDYGHVSDKLRIHEHDTGSKYDDKCATQFKRRLRAAPLVTVKAKFVILTLRAPLISRAQSGIVARGTCYIKFPV